MISGKFLSIHMPLIHSGRKKKIIKNLYLSGIGEEFIAMQLDLEIPIVIGVLTELGE